MRFATFRANPTNRSYRRPRQAWMTFSTVAQRSHHCRFLDSTRAGLPRNASHTPRRIPFAESRTASLRPLPSCRFIDLTALATGAWQPLPLDLSEPRPAPHGISARCANTMIRAPNLQRKRSPFNSQSALRAESQQPFGDHGLQPREASGACLQWPKPL